MKNILLSATIVLIGFAFAQAQPVISKNGILRDTTLNPLEFFDYSKTNTQEFMPQMKEGIIYAGKASHNVMLKNMQVDATSNAARQWFSKVPGVTVWESDGSGLNTSVATRGWSPNRSWDLNVRMDGMDIASDPIGYPEAYYTPPTEFIQNIELIKGAGALAFG
ncbi:MAG: ABC-type iron(III) dicitrate-transport system component, TonB-dependent outer rane receptor FecA, partial [Bacteroidota bacterium]